MNINSLNSAILEYLNSKNYYGAIMLTGEWGTGKSYYLHHELIPCLSKNNKKAIIISLHGLSSPFEISKAVYLEYLLFKAKRKKIRLHKRRKKLAALSVVAKTIVKGVANYFNVELSTSEKNLQKIYESINLKDTLLIFEDVERSNMDPVDVLAYVNNLVEYDCAKVLLITNEQEILKNKGATSKYLTIKEKTVADSYIYFSDASLAISNIFNQYENAQFTGLMNADNKNNEISKIIVDEIKTEKGVDSINLRSIIYCCEKITSLLKHVDKQLDRDFLKSVIISSMVFCHKLKRNPNLFWDGINDDTSSKLGTYHYPLYKFCYDFFVSNDVKKEEIEKTEKDFINAIRDEKTKSEISEVLSVIFNCYMSTEKMVRQAIDQVIGFIKNDALPYDSYLKLANYLIFIKHSIDYEKPIKKCLDLMEINVSKMKEKDLDELHFYGGIALETMDEVKEFEDYKKRINSLVKKNNYNPLDYDYSIEGLHDFCENAIKSKDKYITERSFSSKLDIDKLIQLLKKCSSSEINEIRAVFLSIYSFSNIKDYFSNDASSIDKLLKEIANLKKYSKYDAFQKKQIGYFEGNLTDIFNRLTV